MAEAVWETLTMYNIQSWVCLLTTDPCTALIIFVLFIDYGIYDGQSSNNDTLVKNIEERCRKAGIPFDTTLARLWCMPHTVHLAAIKVSILTESLTHLSF